VLGLLSGHAKLVAGDPGVPALYGMAVHGTMWGLLNGFLHASALLRDEGVQVARFLDDAAASMGALPALLPSTAEEVDRGEYAVPFGALKHHLPSVADLARESADRGIDAAVPEFTLALVSRAVKEGHGDESYSRLVEDFASTD
jgi:hypothetical protein